MSSPEFERAADTISPNEPISRETLYELVWREPMVKVAKYFDVSSSYLARVCSVLGVPRPARGYWAKLAVGKALLKPPLPAALLGHEVCWSRGRELQVVKTLLPKAPERVHRRQSRRERTSRTEHPLVTLAKPLIETGRLSYDIEYLKPSKRLLVDVIASKQGLDQAIQIAHSLYLALEGKGHDVVIAPQHERFHRTEIDEREVTDRNRTYSNLWAPQRSTVTYIGTVAIGLTIIEMTENVLMRYVSGKYVRESEYAPPSGRRTLPGHTWTTERNVPSGRFLVQAYSPYPGTTWTRQWREKKPTQLLGMVPAIVRDLEQASSEIAKLVEDAMRQAELDRQRWEEQRAQWQREEQARLKAKAIKESATELNQIFERWLEARRLAEFFDAIELNLSKLSEGEQAHLRARLTSAKELLCGSDALALLSAWKTPEERQSSTALNFLGS